MLQCIGGIEFHTAGTQHRLLTGLHGQRRVSRQAFGEFKCAWHEALGRHHLVNETNSPSFLCRQSVSGKQHLHGLAVGNLARQAHHRATARHQPTLDLGEAEGSVLRCDAYIRRLEYFSTPGQGITIHRGDHRLVQLERAQKRGGHDAHNIRHKVLFHLCFGLPRPGEQRHQYLEVTAGRKRHVSRTRQNRHAQRFVIAILMPGLTQQDQQFRAEGVACLGPVEREGHDALVLVDE